MAENIDEILDEYKKYAFDRTQPFLMQTYRLSLEYPNDMEFGCKMRALIAEFMKIDKNRIMVQTRTELKNILSENGTRDNKE